MMILAVVQKWTIVSQSQAVGCLNSHILGTHQQINFKPVGKFSIVHLWGFIFLEELNCLAKQISVLCQLGGQD